MTDELRLAGYREPLGLWIRQGPRFAARPELRNQELEFSSRGDRVTGRAILPENGGPHPLVLVQHALGGSAAGVLEAIGTGWVESGAAVAAIDFPLHGARADRKLLRLLCDGRDRNPRRAALALELAQQAVIDLERALDALAATAWIDQERIGYVGFGLGARLGSAFCALDPRPAAAALAPDGEDAVPALPDLAGYLGRIAPRPVLLVGARRNAGDGTSARFEVPGERVEQVWFEAGATELPGVAAEAIWAFLARNLAL
jgi:dienelactone hydrolase